MNRNFFYILAVGFLLVLVCVGLMCSPVSAYPRVGQGFDVYLGESYDVSGVTVGYAELVWCGQYSDWLAPDNSSILYSMKMPELREGYYNFTIDREIFSDRLGYWYHWNGVEESNANMRAFKVVKERPPENYTPNATELRDLALPPTPPVVPERHVSDYLVARGDRFVVDYNWSKASIWLFGRIDGIYDRKIVNGTAIFNASEIDDLEPGTYTLVYYSPGANQRFELRIINGTLEYFDSDEFVVKSIESASLSPMVLLDRIRWLAGVNDDNFTEYNLEVQNPMLEIISADTIILDVFNETGVIQVRGYTNLANESVISFVIDEDKTPERTLGQSRRQNRWNTTVISLENPGSMRYFDYAIPVYLGRMYPGQHTITVYGSYDTRMNVDFYIYDMPEGSQPRNQTIKYVGGYEFVPTPTPEIVIQKEVVKEIVTQIVRVPVTPSDAQVKSQSFNASVEFWSMVVSWLFIIMIVGGIVGYIGYSLWRARRI